MPVQTSISRTSLVGPLSITPPSKDGFNVCTIWSQLVHYTSELGWTCPTFYFGLLSFMTGCSIDCADHDQITPLMLATLSDSEAKCVEYLLVQKANGLLKDHQVRQRQKTTCFEVDPATINAYFRTSTCCITRPLPEIPKH